MQVFKVHIANGLRQPFISVSPNDRAGLASLWSAPIFSRDEKRYVYTEFRQFSVLYIAAGLK